MRALHPFEAEQRRRWMRPDAERWMRSDWQRFYKRLDPDAPPADGDWSQLALARRGALARPISSLPAALLDEGEIATIRCNVAAMRFQLALIKFERVRRKYSPDQPRVPAGVREGGQWVHDIGTTLTPKPAVTTPPSGRRIGGGAPLGRPRGFSPRGPGWHDYTAGPNLVCRAELQCSREEIADQLARFSIPGRNPSIPVADESNNKVYFPGTHHHVGNVETTIADGGLTITNRTDPGHLLFDGKVIRHALQGEDGSWYVTTRGFGNNVTTGMNIPNQLFGPEIFTGLDREMRTNIEWHHGKGFRLTPTRLRVSGGKSASSRYRRWG
jgi:hypothetical protein